MSFKIGGFLKAEFIHDFDAIGSRDTFDPSQIFTDGRPGENTRFHARETRLNLDLRSPSRFGQVRGFAEGDFFGERDSFRLRHAYTELGPMLAGQTWTTFMDTDIIPHTLNFDRAIGIVLFRQAMIRYTHDFDNGWKVAAALEDPTAVIDAPDDLPGKSASPIPDFNSRIRYDWSWGHLQAASMVRQFRFLVDDGTSQNDAGWGFSFSGALEPWQKEKITFQISFGDGLGRYRGVSGAEFDTGNDLQALPTFAWMVGYKHQWFERWHSTAVYSAARVSNLAGQPGDAAHAIQHLIMNLIWRPVEPVEVGVEYQFGTREDKDGSRGEANRMQFAVWYYLP